MGNPAESFAALAESAIGELERLRQQKARLVDALQEIALGEGPFNRDPLTHAANCIDAMKHLAAMALRDVGAAGAKEPAK